MTERTSNGRGWAYTGTILGALVSIAANVAHSFVPPTNAGAAWQPPTGAIAFAAFWPVALFVAIEMLARVAWRSGWRYGLLRFGGLVPVAGTAAIVSYLHLAGLLAHYGEPKLTTVIGPLAVDGLMTMSAAALMSTSPTQDTPALETVPEQTSETPPEQPKERVPRPLKQTARRNAPKRRTEEQLLAEAEALNADALANTGEPVPARRLMSELRIGHPAATKLLDALTETAPENTPAAVPEHVDGELVAAV